MKLKHFIKPIHYSLYHVLQREIIQIKVNQPVKSKSVVKFIEIASMNLIDQRKDIQT